MQTNKMHTLYSSSQFDQCALAHLPVPVLRSRRRTGRRRSASRSSRLRALSSSGTRSSSTCASCSVRRPPREPPPPPPPQANGVPLPLPDTPLPRPTGVPYEGVSRMQTSLKRKHRDRVVRRGLALIIESDFVRFRPLRTPVPAPALTSTPCSCAVRHGRGTPALCGPYAPHLKPHPSPTRSPHATHMAIVACAELTSIRYCVQEVRCAPC